MAKMKKGILGAISGKIGPVIGGIWKGIPYLRQVPKKKKQENKEPCSNRKQAKAKVHE